MLRRKFLRSMCIASMGQCIYNITPLCCLVYIVEVAVRLIVVGPVVYFRKWWNRSISFAFKEKSFPLNCVWYCSLETLLCRMNFKCSVDFILVTASFVCLCVEALLYAKYPVTGYLSVVRPLVVLR